MRKTSHFGFWIGVGSLVLASLVVVPTVRANHVAFYGVGKERVYEQSSDSLVSPASSGGFRFTAFAVPSSTDSIVFVTVAPAASAMTQLFLDNVTGGFTLSDSAQSAFDTQADLDTNLPDGVYTLDAFSADVTSVEGPANLTLSGDVYPTATPTANFTAAQAVNSTNDFIVTWTPQSGTTADDYVQLTVTNGSGDLVFNSGFPGQASALPGTAASVTIPANILEAGNTYSAALTFGHITSRDQTDYPGGVGMTTFSQQTRFSLKTTGSPNGGGNPGGSEPILILTNPFNGQKDVPVTSPIVFTFLVPMQPVQKIAWSANVTAANFSYSWSTSGTNLTAKDNTDWPANATVTWTLDPTVFKAQDGTPLIAINNSGSFTTGSGGSTTNNLPCTGGSSTNSGFGSISLFKSVRYLQTSASTPVIDGSDGATFAASVTSPATNPVTSASIQFNGISKPLTNLAANIPGLAGQFLLFDSFSSESAMNVAYPAGAYTLTIIRAGGTATLTLNLPANAVPPIPQITDLAQTLSLNPTNDFTVQWGPFTNAVPNDSIAFDLTDGHGTDFRAPDYCLPRPLTNTATSILIPKNTFGVGAVIDGSLSFEKVTGFDTNSIPTMPAFAGYSKMTEFRAGSGGTTTQPKLKNVVHLPNGTVSLEVQGSAGATLTVEASTDLKTWVPLHSELSATGVLDFSDAQAAGMNYRFYRARAK
jgi:hypothetical protein